MWRLHNLIKCLAPAKYDERRDDVTEGPDHPGALPALTCNKLETRQQSDRHQRLQAALGPVTRWSVRKIDKWKRRSNCDSSGSSFRDNTEEGWADSLWFRRGQTVYQISRKQELKCQESTGAIRERSEHSKNQEQQAKPYARYWNKLKLHVRSQPNSFNQHANALEWANWSWCLRFTQFARCAEQFNANYRGKQPVVAVRGRERHNCAEGRHLQESQRPVHTAQTRGGWSVGSDAQLGKFHHTAGEDVEVERGHPVDE